jgi:CubicO group peptidase (beta-lactamase class C family)
MYPDLAALVDKIGEVGPTHAPGGRYNYSDAGSSTLAHIVSVVSGMSAEDFIRKNIIVPLGLADTDCNMFKDNPLRPRVSSTYRLMGSKWIKYWVNTMRQAVPYFRGSGGMYSTTLDYAKFLAMWMDRGESGEKRFLSPEIVEAALAPSSLSVRGNEGYGYQWQIFRRSDGVFGHGGSDGTVAIASPEDDLIFLCFTQSRGGSAVSQMRSLFFDVFSASLRLAQDASHEICSEKWL